MKYLTPYYTSIKIQIIQRFVFGEEHGNNKTVIWGFYIQEISNGYKVYYDRNYSIWKIFNSINLLEEAKQFLDEKYIEQGYILLTEEQCEKLKVLL